MGKKILMVEDDSSFAEPLIKFFRFNGFIVFWAKNGKKGIEYFEQENPDIILLDVELPDIDGFEVAKRIQLINNLTPIIFMTGTALEQKYYNDAFMNIKAINYIEKPFRYNLVLAQINGALYPKSTKFFEIENTKVRIESQDLIINNLRYTFRDKDIEVLSLLLTNIDKVVNRKDIMMKIWKSEDINCNSKLDQSINRIRAILKESNVFEISVTYGIGYRLSMKQTSA